LGPSEALPPNGAEVFCPLHPRTMPGSRSKLGIYLSVCSLRYHGSYLPNAMRWGRTDSVKPSADTGPTSCTVNPSHLPHQAQQLVAGHPTSTHLRTRQGDRRRPTRLDRLVWCLHRPRCLCHALHGDALHEQRGHPGAGLGYHHAELLHRRLCGDRTSRRLCGDLYFALVLPMTRTYTLPTSFVAGLAVCGMHYVGMYGMQYE
jgi:hypothetical protein